VGLRTGNMGRPELASTLRRLDAAVVFAASGCCGEEEEKGTLLGGTGER